MRKEELVYEPVGSAWRIMAEITGREVSLETDEEGQKWISRSSAFYVYNVDLDEGALLAIDRSTGLPSLTIDEASRFLDTSEIQRAIRRSRRKVIKKPRHSGNPELVEGASRI